MKVIVTGASGFLGKNFLLKSPREWQIIALYNQRSDFPRFIKEYKLKHVSARRCDLTQEKSVSFLIKEIGHQFDLCVYLAANGDPTRSTQEPSLDLRQNVLALLNFLTSVQVKKFVFFSSGAVYDGLKGLVSPEVKVRPHLPYAISKLASEQYIRFFHKKGSLGGYVILRFFGAYGPHEPPRKIYTKLVNAFYLNRENEFAVVGDGKNLIDAMYVEDAIDGILKVIRSPRKNVTVDFASGHPVSIDSLIKRAASVFKCHKFKIIHQGTVAEYISFHVSRNQMTKYFGFKPTTSLEKGLTKLARFLEIQKS